MLSYRQLREVRLFPSPLLLVCYGWIAPSNIRQVIAPNQSDSDSPLFSMSVTGFDAQIFAELLIRLRFEDIKTGHCLSGKFSHADSRNTLNAKWGRRAVSEVVNEDASEVRTSE